jgi:hypothetical protein
VLQTYCLYERVSTPLGAIAMLDFDGAARVVFPRLAWPQPPAASLHGCSATICLEVYHCQEGFDVALHEGYIGYEPRKFLEAWRCVVTDIRATSM